MNSRMTWLMVLPSVVALALSGCLPRPAPGREGQPAAPPPALQTPAGAERRAALGRLPLYFVENQGQLDPRVAYYGSVQRTSVYFTPSGVTYALVSPGPALG